MLGEIKYHPKAWAEAFGSARYYNGQQEGLGADFFDSLDTCVTEIRQDPLRQKPDEDGVRSRRLRRFPFRVYYVIDPNRIRILAVAHLKRRAGYLRQRVEE